MSHDSDVDALAARAQAGDRGAFEALVRRLVRPALAAAWEFVPTREDAEDIVQEAFARAWRQLARYDTARPFAPWFFTILRNVARNAIRRDQRWDVVPLTDDVAADTMDEAGAALDHAREMAGVESALDALPPMQRACFRLTLLEGFATAQAAAMLGIGEATVRVHVHRARRTLRAALGDERRPDRS